MSKLTGVLRHRRATLLLVLLHGLVGLGIFLIAARTPFPDAQGYWHMGQSLLQGKFSSWHFLSKYYPETLRTPGYPAFLAIWQLLGASMWVVKAIQLVLYFVALYLMTRTLAKISADRLYVNLFLLVALPNIQIVYYAGYISAEMLAIACMALCVYLLFLPRTKINALWLGLAFFALFITKPSFLLLPFGLAVLMVLQKRSAFAFSAIFVAVFVVLLLPFGLWNKANHGTFKLTSLEGGAGAAHMGYWQLKLPNGYQEKFYWNNSVGYDITRPGLFTQQQHNAFVQTYEAEWRSLLDSISPLVTVQDSVYLDSMQYLHPTVFKLYNSQYTQAREAGLWQLTTQHIKANPGYFALSRLYHLGRSYVTGINYKDLQAASGPGIIKVVYPFAVTFVCILLGLLVSLAYWLPAKRVLPNKLLLLAMALYAGLIHVPFVIQARYTVPVHFIVLLLVALMLGRWLGGAKAASSNTAP